MRSRGHKHPPALTGTVRRHGIQQGGFAPAAPPPPLAVSFSAEAEQQLQPWLKAHPELRQLVSEVLAQDPRPAYKKGKPDEKEYGVRLFDCNVRFRISEPDCVVLAIEPA